MVVSREFVQKRRAPTRCLEAHKPVARIRRLLKGIPKSEVSDSLRAHEVSDGHGCKAESESQAARNVAVGLRSELGRNDLRLQ